MSTKPISKPRRKAAGRVAAPAVIFALLSVLLAMSFERIGLLGGVATTLRSGYARIGLADLTPVGWPALWAALGLAALALAWAVLDSPQLWRRLVLGVGALVITAAWSPVLATLGYDLPVAPLLLGIGWAWFCATTYAQQHRMPCDPAAPAHS